MDAILVGIDGTGVIDKADYRRELGTSFVRWIVSRTPARLKQYVQGPWYEGFDMSLIVDKAYTFTRLSIAAQPRAKVFLTGYSRGGAGVIALAERLLEDGVNVDGMVLFDAVDRSLAVDSTEIPRNVQRLAHARRDPQAQSRTNFGNAGTVWHAPTRCAQRFFYGTHGAVGGVPARTPPDGKATDIVSESYAWKATKVTYAQDARCASEVWAWINPHLIRLGFLGGKTDQVSNT